jgi:hypothetical protein
LQRGVRHRVRRGQHGGQRSGAPTGEADDQIGGKRGEGDEGQEQQQQADPVVAVILENSIGAAVRAARFVHGAMLSRR